MGDQNFSIILTVDLSCDRCFKKIEKILVKHKEKWSIQSTLWDHKKNKITVTGPFCPHNFAKKIRLKDTSQVIKNVDFPEDKCKCHCEAPPPPPCPSPAPKTDPPPPAPKSDSPSKSKPDPPPPCPNLLLAYPYPYPVWPTGCCCPWYKGQGTCGCGGKPHGGRWPCASVCGWGTPIQQQADSRPCHGGGRQFDFVYEESPCRPM